VAEHRVPFFPRDEPTAEDRLAVVAFNAPPALQIADWSLDAIDELNVPSGCIAVPSACRDENAPARVGGRAGRTDRDVDSQ